MRRLRAQEKDPKRMRRMRHWYADYRAEPVDYAWFEKIMEADHAECRYLADFSNLNCFLTPDNWSDVKSNYVKHLRVLYIMRDPVARIWSHFKYHLQFSKHPAAKEPDQDFTLFKQVVGKNWFWRNACYAETVTALKSALASDQLKIAYFEDMIYEPQEFLCSIEAFLDLPELQYSSDLSVPRNRSIGTLLPQPWHSYLCEIFEGQFRQLANAGLGHKSWSQTLGSRNTAL